MPSFGTIYANVGDANNANINVSANSVNTAVITNQAGVYLFPIFESGGRITLTANTPVMNASVSNTSIIYYTFYKHNFVMTFDGTKLVPISLTEQLSINISANAANSGPGATGANNIYDLFVWNNNGVPTLSIGPAWANNTSRGSGSGTSELDQIQSLGLLTNNQNIINGPPAHKGTYVGTISTNTFGRVDWNLGGFGTGGIPATLNVWNMNNRILIKGEIGDTTPSWTWSSNTAHPANASNGVRVSFVSGLMGDYFYASYCGAAISSATNGQYSTGVGYNSTSNFSGIVSWNYANAINASFASIEGKFSTQQLGFGYMQALEQTNGQTEPGAAFTFYNKGMPGQPAGAQGGMHYEGMF